MFNRNQEEDPLDKAIEAVFADMDGFTSDSEEYDAMTKQLDRLYSLRDQRKSHRQVSPDVLATVAANLVGIMIIVGHERAHVVTSKAVQFVMKAR